MSEKKGSRIMTSDKPESAAREFYVCELLSGEIYAFKDYQSGRTKFVEASRLEAAQANQDEMIRKYEFNREAMLEAHQKMESKLTSAMEMISVMQETLEQYQAAMSPFDSIVTEDGATIHAEWASEALSSLEAWKGKR